MIYQSGRLPTLAHRVVLEIAMSTIGDAGSAAAILIAFSLERIIRRAALVDCRGVLVRGRGLRVSVHAASSVPMDGG